MNQRTYLRKVHSKNSKSFLISNGIYFGQFLPNDQECQLSPDIKTQSKPVLRQNIKIRKETIITSLPRKRLQSPVSRIDTNKSLLKTVKTSIAKPQTQRISKYNKSPSRLLSQGHLQTSVEINKSQEILEQLANNQINKISRMKSRPQTATTHKTNQLSITMKDQYLVTEMIGKGSYGVVKLAINKINGEQVAMKIYDLFLQSKEQSNQQKIRNNIQKPRPVSMKDCIRKEIQILRQLRHPNIITLLDVIYTETQIQLVMEYPGSISLRYYLKSQLNQQLNEIVAKDIFQQIVKAVAYCHSQNIIHRDIKLENILIKEGRIKLIDFGFSTSTNQSQKFYCGTPSYMAPELILKMEYGKPADVWSLGILLYILLNGRFPFVGRDQNELFQKIKSGYFIYIQNISSQVQQLINSMLKVRPYERITAKEILKNQWFKQQ